MGFSLLLLSYLSGYKTKTVSRLSNEKKKKDHNARSKIPNQIPHSQFLLVLSSGSLANEDVLRQDCRRIGKYSAFCCLSFLLPTLVVGINVTSN